MDGTAIGIWGVPLAILAGAIRVSTPFLFVSLGECLTEKSGRINLGLEGTLVLGAMAGYAISYLSGSPWLGVLVAGLCGSVMGAIHGYVCKLPKVNDVAIGIALMMFGTGLAFFLGKPFIQPVAPKLPSIPLGAWSALPQVQAALQLITAFGRSPMAGLVDLRRVDVSAPGVVTVTTGQGSVITFGLDDQDQQLRRWRQIYDLGLSQQKSIATADLAVANNVPVRWMMASAVPATVTPKAAKPSKNRRRNV